MQKNNKKTFIKKIKIKNIEFENNLALAPLAGITIKPFRVNLEKMGAKILFTEMISSYGVIYENKKTIAMVDVKEEKHPIIVQIFGNNADIMADSARKLQDFGVEIIDINMGCPAPKVVSSGSGSALLKDIKKVEEIIRKVRASIQIPLTLKIRAGWDLESINALEVSKIAENEGIDLLTVHARTKSQKFNDFNWDIISQVKNNVKIPVIGNGNIFSPYDVKNMFEQTNCDGFMIARASFSNPWIFKQILEFDEKGTFDEISDEDKLNYILQFSRDFIEYKGDRGIFELRKFIVWLTKGLPNSRILREEFFSIKSLSDVDDIIKRYKKS
jgi:tRNA-dihydrouridine synthase B